MAAIWEPGQYLRFADARNQPALDLLARVALDAPRRIYDLGCGTGNVTRLLRARWPAATLTGVDDSAPMLARAAADLPEVAWVQQSLGEWRPPQPADLVFSNAALHWLGAHDTLLPRLLAAVAPGGALAVQMPRNFAAPSHAAIGDTVRAGPWRTRLEPLLRPAPVASPDWYYRLLEPLAATVTVWETEYLQVLAGTDPVKEWVKGTWLKPFLDALTADEREAFEAEYARRVRVAYPPLASGVTLFPFRRLFIVAHPR
jgi:trans-aconitate 2-methyltransferase